MDDRWGAFSVVGAILLRIGVPAVITIGAVQLFRRLDVRWQAQDWQHWSKRLETSGGAAGRDWLARLADPCWDEYNCDESAVVKCSAHKHQSIPCWMARRAVEGGMPTKCYQCERYTMGSLVAAA
jgi:hypothetical protein